MVARSPAATKDGDHAATAVRHAARRRRAAAPGESPAWHAECTTRRMMLDLRERTFFGELDQLSNVELLALVLGTGMLALSINVYRLREGREAARATRRLFAFSILYLFLLFAVLLVDRGWGGLIARWAT